MPMFSTNDPALAEAITSMNDRLLAVEGRTEALRLMLIRVQPLIADEHWTGAAAELSHIIADAVDGADEPTAKFWRSALETLADFGSPTPSGFRPRVIPGGLDQA